MIFTLRLLVFSFFIILGFRISVRSIKGRGAVSGIYVLVLVWYTFLCRVHLYVNVSADDYGHTTVTMGTGEKVLQLLRAIFGMQANGNLAGNYREAFVLNVLLMIPLGYLCLLWMICGDAKTASSSDSFDSRVKDVEGAATTEKSRTLAKSALKSILICIITSFAVEVTQEITTLGMFDINDILANSIGSCIGIGMVWLWQHFRSLLIKSQEVI